jgi:hypothetical protein
MNSAPNFQREDPPPQANNLLSLQIPISAAWAIFSTLLFGGLWTSWQLWDLRQSIRDGTTDRWRKSYQREWANRFQQQNPTVKVPSVDQVVKDLD